MESPANTLPELLTEAECIRYLRLDADERQAPSRLRNAIRRQGLPVIQRGRIRLFRKAAVDAWLDGDLRGGKIKTPARLGSK